MITCSTCNVAYVGDTGQKLRERLNGHRADIRNKADTPVGVHFGMSDHHLHVSGLERTSSDTWSRRLWERAWICFIQKSNVFTCMNRDNGVDILTLWLSFLQAAHPTNLSTHCHLEHPEDLYLSPLFTTSMYSCTDNPASHPISLSAVHSCFSHLLCPFRCSSHPPSQHV